MTKPYAHAQQSDAITPMDPLLCRTLKSPSFAVLSTVVRKAKVSIHDGWAAMRLLACIDSLFRTTPFFHVVGTHPKVDSAKACQMRLMRLLHLLHPRNHASPWPVAIEMESDQCSESRTVSCRRTLAFPQHPLPQYMCTQSNRQLM